MSATTPTDVADCPTYQHLLALGLSQCRLEMTDPVSTTVPADTTTNESNN